MAARKRNELIAFQKVKDALSEEVCDDANMVPKVEAIAKMDTLVAVFPIVVR